MPTSKRLVKAARSMRLSAVHDGAAALSGEGRSPELSQEGGSEVAKKLLCSFALALA